MGSKKLKIKYYMDSCVSYIHNMLKVLWKENQDLGWYFEWLNCDNKKIINNIMKFVEGKVNLMGKEEEWFECCKHVASTSLTFREKVLLMNV